MSRAQILEDIFEILEKDPDGKKFDKGEACNKSRAPLCLDRGAGPHCH
jgi:hypothetical protein